MIPFNKPYVTGKEVHYIYDAVASGHISGNGKYTKLCQKYFEDRYAFKKALLTTSCTDALEMCALLIDIQPGDEVIIPSYTFVSTALAFVRQGAKIVFADSRNDHPNINESKIEELITSKTKAIVPVHYAGMACDMDVIMALAEKYSLFVIEDAAQAIESFYKGKALGTIGHLSTFSFHETKNIQTGEGGLLGINDERFINRAEILWEKGTNRAAFFRGEVDKYGWVDIGSSFLPADIIAAFLYAQLENIEKIQKKRITNWHLYYKGLLELQEKGKITLPIISEYGYNNAHMFYIICNSLKERTNLIAYLNENKINVVFHYLSLHKSSYYINNNGVESDLPMSDFYTDHLLRLPMYYELNDKQVHYITDKIIDFFNL